MADERQESTREGIAPAPESNIGREADERRRSELRHAPPETRPDSAMGGTSDADSAGDEAWTPPQGDTGGPRGAAEPRPDEEHSPVHQDEALRGSERLPRIGTEEDKPPSDRFGD
jgi:hypothetical protein